MHELRLNGGKVHKVRSRRDGRFLLLPVLAVLAAACQREPAVSADAAGLYRTYCASCHGVDGRGDGPAAAALQPPPTDLTQSTLSLAELMQVIDGRRTIRAHGNGAMPVWGPAFEDALKDDSRRHRDALRQVQMLAEYVRAMAAKGAPPEPQTPAS